MYLNINEVKSSEEISVFHKDIENHLFKTQQPSALSYPYPQIWK